MKNFPLVVLSSLCREIISHSAILHLKVIVPDFYSIFRCGLQCSEFKLKGDTASAAVVIFTVKTKCFGTISSDNVCHQLMYFFIGFNLARTDYGKWILKNGSNCGGLFAVFS